MRELSIADLRKVSTLAQAPVQAPVQARAKKYTPAVVSSGPSAPTWLLHRIVDRFTKGFEIGGPYKLAPIRKKTFSNTASDLWNFDVRDSEAKPDDADDDDDDDPDPDNPDDDGADEGLAEMEFSLVHPGREQAEEKAKRRKRDVMPDEAKRFKYIRSSDLPNTGDLVFAERGGYDRYLQDQLEQTNRTILQKRQASNAPLNLEAEDAARQKRMGYVQREMSLYQGADAVTWASPMRLPMFALKYKLQYGNDDHASGPLKPGLMRFVFRLQGVMAGMINETEALQPDLLVGEAFVSSNTGAAGAGGSDDALGGIVQGNTASIGLMGMKTDTETVITDEQKMIATDCLRSFVRTGEVDRTRHMTMDVFVADNGDGFPATDTDGMPSWELTKYQRHVMTLTFSIEYRWRSMDREYARNDFTAREMVYPSRFITVTEERHPREFALQTQALENATIAAEKYMMHAYANDEVVIGFVHKPWRRVYMEKKTLQMIPDHGGNDRDVARDEYEYYKGLNADRGWNAIRNDESVYKDYQNAIYSMYKDMTGDRDKNPALAQDEEFQALLSEVCGYFIEIMKYDLSNNSSYYGDQYWIDEYNFVASKAGADAIVFDESRVDDNVQMNAAGAAADAALEAMDEGHQADLYQQALDDANGNPDEDVEDAEDVD